MSNGDAALQTLFDESREAIKEAKNVPGMKSCLGHSAVVHISTLNLRWQVHQAETRIAWRRKLCVAGLIMATTTIALLTGNWSTVVRIASVAFGGQ